MKRFLAYCLLGIPTCSLFSCGASNQNDRGTATMPGQTMVESAVPPNACRIMATVLKVNEDSLAGSEQDPCSQVPCLATVRIDSILGYGSGFSSPMAVGKTIEVRFRFTLSATQKIFPSMSPPLPGLTETSKFKADVQSFNVPPVSLDYTARYSIDRYKKIK